MIFSALNKVLEINYLLQAKFHVYCLVTLLLIDVYWINFPFLFQISLFLVPLRKYQQKGRKPNKKQFIQHIIYMNIQVHDKIFSPYLSQTQIHTRVAELGAQLNATYQNQNLLLLPILNGSFVFAADLVRKLQISPDIQFVKISSYGNEMESNQKINSVFGLDNLQIEGNHILIIEDIVDSGFTVDFLMEYLGKQKPASLKICTLLYKPDSFKGKNKPDFVGFSIPSDFVVGYGLDYAQKGRELDSIYVLAQP